MGNQERYRSSLWVPYSCDLCHQVGPSSYRISREASAIQAGINIYVSMTKKGQNRQIRYTLNMWEGLGTQTFIPKDNVNWRHSKGLEEGSRGDIESERG